MTSSRPGWLDPPSGRVALGLAPMEGTTDLGTRLWLALTAPPDFAYSPFLRVNREFMPKSIPETFAPELSTIRDTVPYTLVPQIMAARPDDFVRMATPLLETTPIVDINCGCPSPTVLGRGAGSRLLDSPESFDAFLGEIVRGIGANRLSIKMRTGIEDHGELDSLLQVIRGHPVAVVVVHGRTRREKYSGLARWDRIEHAQKTLRCPVIGSGDICSARTLQERLAMAPSVIRIMAGRGALRNPWLFGELRTGRPVEITAEALLTSIWVFALLQFGLQDCRKSIFRLAAKGLFLTPCGTSPERWRSAFEKLTLALLGKPLAAEERTFNNRILDRVKMLWKHLQSSVPADMRDPALLRSNSFAVFRSRMIEVGQAWVRKRGSPLTLVHDPLLDPLYSSDRGTEASQTPVLSNNSAK